jgi:hypothetical protein
MVGIALRLLPQIGYLLLGIALAALSSNLRQRKPPSKVVPSLLWVSTLALIGFPLIRYASNGFIRENYIAPLLTTALLLLSMATSYYWMRSKWQLTRWIPLAQLTLLVGLQVASLASSTLVLPVLIAAVYLYIDIYTLFCIFPALEKALRPRQLGYGTLLIALAATVSTMLFSQTQANPVLAVSSSNGVIVALVSRPTTKPDLDKISGGLTTAGLGRIDSTLQFAISGVIKVSKPNFHQIVSLYVIAHIITSRHATLHLLLEGVPQPDGALSLVHTRLFIASLSPHLFASGYATRFLDNSVVGGIKIHGHPFSYLLSYQPVGFYRLRGTLTLWPKKARLDLKAL